MNPIDQAVTAVAPRSTVNLATEREAILARLGRLQPTTDAYASEFVDAVLDFAHTVGTSDVHLQPSRSGLEVKFRSEGVMQSLGSFPRGANTSVINRFKVLSGLLTYQNDIPQEGRVEKPKHSREIRVSTFPTMYGERAVLRFFGHDREFTTLDALGNDPAVTRQIRDALAETSGAMLITGPAGSGKSTTLYACLRHLVSTNDNARAIVSLEDPIEVPVDGVTQSQVNLQAGFDLKTGLRSLMRQDPEVIVVGEIRDRDTAEFAIQAALTGQLLLGTFHADTSATAVTRLIEMGIEPFLVRSGLIAVLSQRLLRILCRCSRESTDPADFGGLPVERVRLPVGCPDCNQTGFAGRVIISEYLDLRTGPLGPLILRKADSRELYRVAQEAGMATLLSQATALVREGRTSPSEVFRVLGSSTRME
jgi:type II secretory ATPase GspE/PulE/Tfp pilus assembly ATPase PilB-like protein